MVGRGSRSSITSAGGAPEGGLMADIVLLYVTASSKQEAQSLGQTLVEERLAACVNIYPEITSIYWWEGKMETSSEAVLIVKTRSDLVSQVKERLLDLHSYSCPCILVVPVAGGHKPFIDWLLAETRKGHKESEDAQ